MSHCKVDGMFGCLDGMFGWLDGMFGCLDGMFGWLVSPSSYLSVSQWFLEGCKWRRGKMTDEKLRFPCLWGQKPDIFVDAFDMNNWVVVSNIVYFHPYLGKSNLTNILQMGWNHQLDNVEKRKLIEMTKSLSEASSCSPRDVQNITHK